MWGHHYQMLQKSWRGWTFQKRHLTLRHFGDLYLKRNSSGVERADNSLQWVNEEAEVVNAC